MKSKSACLLVLAGLLGPVSAQTIDNVTISKKTEIFITLERSISSRTASTGDKFYGRIAVPVTVNDKIVLPVGSYVIGHVDTSKEAGRLRGKAELGLKFDTIILPDGTTRDIRAVLASAEGYETGSPDEEGKIQASGGQAEDIGKGTLAGGTVGGTIGGLGSRSWRGVGIGAGAGAATGAIIGALKKNREVDLPKGASITVVLDSDIRFAKPEPPSQGKPL
ncbi:MAG: hypothetical protein EHM61_02670 [Acidobacteria bacterium]|nr:MAG: hypothetical protein EHM61_02670 [Acidobacteriota bacterium]